MESLNKEEVNLYLTKNHQHDKVTSHFFYQDLFRICKKLTKEMSKLEQIISTSKDTIVLSPRGLLEGLTINFEFLKVKPMNLYTS